MSEPLRKRHKCGQTVERVEAREGHGQDDPLVFTTQHAERPAEIDLRAFASGLSRPNIGRGCRKWKGDFNGRPQLISDLAQAIRIICAHTPSTTWGTRLGYLRQWWRLLDQYDDVAPVSCLEGLTDAHGALSMRNGMQRDAVNFFRAAVNLARLNRGLAPLYWPTTQVTAKPANLPSQETVAHLYHFLKQKIYACIDRFDRCDAAAEMGVDWSSSYRSREPRQPWTIEDKHATFRGIIQKTLHPRPDKPQALSAIDALSTRALDDVSELAFGMYPSWSDVNYLYFMFLLRTGWNGQTALDIDITGPYLIPHPVSTDHHVVQSFKTRGNTQQAAIGLNKSQLSPGGILSLLVARTAPLREYLKVQLSTLEAELSEKGGNAKLIVRLAELRRLVRSPWIFVPRKGEVISCLDAGSQGGPAAQFKMLQAEYNEINRQDVKADLILSDFRDAYIAFAYEKSGYAWLVAKLAAGHSSVESIKSYLRHRQHKAHGEKKVVRLVETFWDEIRTEREADPAIVFARVERGGISELQRQRWNAYKDRTRCGAACRDFSNPPPQISPHHVPGSGCRVQRCTLCEHAIFFRDSLHHLARRLAEVKFLEKKMPLTSWFDSSFAHELQTIEEVLKVYDQNLVKKSLAYWNLEIEEGRHAPLQFEGEYG